MCMGKKRPCSHGSGHAYEYRASISFLMARFLKRYGKVLYGIFTPTHDILATAEATKAFLDLMFSERKQFPLKSEEADAERIRSNYFAYLMADVQESEVVTLLQRRRYAMSKARLVLERPGWPSGLSATTMMGTARRIHPNTTYGHLRRWFGAGPVG